MAFTFIEIAGERPVDEWLAARIKEFVRRTYGLEVEVRIPDRQEPGGQAERELR